MAKSKSEAKYVHAPLHIFNNFQQDTIGTISKFFNIGIYIYASQIQFTHKEVIRQLLYHFYHNKSSLSSQLEDFVDSLFEDNNVDPDYNYLGFVDGNSFNVDDTINDMWDSYMSADEHILNDAIIFYKLEQAKDLLELSFENQVIITEHAKFQYSSRQFENRHGKDANVSLEIKMLFDFLKNEKTSFEYDLLAGYVAIKSIQGQAQFARTNKAFIAQRMLGCKSKKVLEDVLKSKENKEFYKRVNGRYQMDKILDQLWQKNFIQCKIGIGRSIYISTHLDELTLPTAIAQTLNIKNTKEKENIAKEHLKRLLTQS